MSWLMAGATGLLGRSIAQQAGPELTLLLRGSDWPDRATMLGRRIGRSVRGVSGDVTAELWGADTCALDDIELVMNVAAQTAWAAHSDDLAATNVKGALEGLRLSATLGVPYVLVSTLYVGYATTGVVPETLLDARPGLSRYERSKFDGEWAVADAAARLDVPVLIVRVGCLIGDAQSGDRKRAKWVPFLRMFQAISERRLGVVPVGRHARLDVGPTDVVAAATCRLAANAVPTAGVAVRHVSLGSRAPLARSILAEIDAALRRSGQKGFLQVPTPTRALLRWSALADRYGEGPWAAAHIGLRYLGSEQTFTVSDGAIDFDWTGLRRGLGLVDPEIEHVAPFYREWLCT